MRKEKIMRFFLAAVLAISMLAMPLTTAYAESVSSSSDAAPSSAVSSSTGTESSPMLRLPPGRRPLRTFVVFLRGGVLPRSFRPPPGRRSLRTFVLLPGQSPLRTFRPPPGRRPLRTFRPLPGRRPLQALRLPPRRCHRMSHLLPVLRIQPAPQRRQIL